MNVNANITSARNCCVLVQQMHKDLSAAKQTMHDHGVRNQNYQAAMDNLKCLEDQLFLTIGRLYVENSMTAKEKVFGPDQPFT